VRDTTTLSLSGECGKEKTKKQRKSINYAATTKPQSRGSFLPSAPTHETQSSTLPLHEQQRNAITRHNTAQHNTTQNNTTQQHNTTTQCSLWPSTDQRTINQPTNPKRNNTTQ